MFGDVQQKPQAAPPTAVEGNSPNGRPRTGRVTKMLCQTLLAIAIALVAGEIERRRNGRRKVVKKRRTPRFWVRPWIKRRDERATLYDLRIEMQASVI